MRLYAVSGFEGNIKLFKKALPESLFLLLQNVTLRAGKRLNKEQLYKSATPLLLLAVLRPGS